jgi:hypothetical protein
MTNTYNIWTASAIPGTITDNDPNAVELGVKFRADINGNITGIRFYKGPSNTGTHVGSLWSSTGTLLAQATFTGETPSGWQQVTFATPVPVTAGMTYIASYHTNVGLYSGDINYFASSGVDNPPLHALQNGIDGGNGVYTYSASPIFPTSTYLSSNYWVDIIFTSAINPSGAMNIMTGSMVIKTGTLYTDVVHNLNIANKVLPIPLSAISAAAQCYITNISYNGFRLNIRNSQTLDCPFDYEIIQVI